MSTKLKDEKACLICCSRDRRPGVLWIWGRTAL